MCVCVTQVTSNTDKSNTEVAPVGKNVLRKVKSNPNYLPLSDQESPFPKKYKVHKKIIT